MIPLIAAGLYGMAGWQNSKNRDRRNAREDAADARATELHTAKMSEIAAAQKARDDEDAYKDSIKASMSAGQQTPVTQGVGDAGSSFDVKDPQVAAVMADMGAAKGEAIDTNAATRVSTGAAGATQNGTVAGKQVIADPAQAQSVAKSVTMSDYAKLQARQQVAEKFGKVDIADDIRGKLQKLEAEGAFKALALAKNGDFEGAAKHYQATGADRMPEGARFDSAIVVDPATKTERTVIRMVGKDGAPIIPDVDMALRSYLSPAEQYTMNRGDKQDIRDATRDKQSQENWQQTFDFNKKKEENDTQYKNRVLGFQAAADRRAAETHKIAMDSEKVPAAVKLQATSLSKEMEGISSAMNKAMAEGSFDPNSANAKALIERQAMLGIKYRQLLEPHMPGGKEKAAADPSGFDKPAPGAAPAGAVAPQAAPKPAATAAKPMASMQQVAPAMVTKAPTVLEALNPGGNASLSAVTQPKAQAIESLAAQLKQEQAAMAQAANSNPQSAIAQAQKVQGIRNAINKQLEGMNPEQAALVIKAAGI